MKLNRKKKKVTRPLSKRSGVSSKKTMPHGKVQSAGKFDWAITDPDAIKDKHEKLASEKALLRRDRPPEVMFIAGIPKIIRFRSSDPLATFESYTVKLGNRFQEYTAPPAGKKDLFEEYGNRRLLRTVWNVIDINGYTNKKGETFKKIPCFLKANQTLAGQLQTLHERLGSLTGRDFEITRSGTGKSTSYVIIQLDPKKRNLTGIENVAAKFGEYYKPPTLEEQKAIFENISPVEDEDDDD